VRDQFEELMKKNGVIVRRRLLLFANRSLLVFIAFIQSRSLDLTHVRHQQRNETICERITYDVTNSVELHAGKRISTGTRRRSVRIDHADRSREIRSAILSRKRCNGPCASAVPFRATNRASVPIDVVARKIQRHLCSDASTYTLIRAFRHTLVLAFTTK